jgi:hypothetical protein
MWKLRVAVLLARCAAESPRRTATDFVSTLNIFEYAGLSASLCYLRRQLYVLWRTEELVSLHVDTRRQVMAMLLPDIVASSSRQRQLDFLVGLNRMSTTSMLANRFHSLAPTFAC